MCHQAHSQNSGAKKLSALRLCVLRLLWAKLHHKAAAAHFGVFLAGPHPKSCITLQFRPVRDPILKTCAQFASGGAPQSFHALSFYNLISL